jgi:tetratricopeptide (TPR) repeat protein
MKEPLSQEEKLYPSFEEEMAFRKRVDDIYLNLDRLNANELLEIDISSDEKTLKLNFHRLVREFHPDRYFRFADPTMKDKINSIFKAIIDAYNLLKDNKKRIDYFMSSGRVPKEEFSNTEIAEEQFKRSVVEFKKGNFWGAVDFLKWATKLEPKNAKYWSYLSLSLSEIPKRLKDAEEALLEAIKLDPYNARYYVSLGMIYVKAGTKQRAYKQFEKALKLDPENIKAKKWLKQTKV